MPKIIDKGLELFENVRGVWLYETECRRSSNVNRLLSDVADDLSDRRFNTNLLGA